MSDTTFEDIIHATPAQREDTMLGKLERAKLTGADTSTLNTEAMCRIADALEYLAASQYVG